MTYANFTEKRILFLTRIWEMTHFSVISVIIITLIFKRNKGFFRENKAITGGQAGGTGEGVVNASYSSLANI